MKRFITILFMILVVISSLFVLEVEAVEYTTEISETCIKEEEMVEYELGEILVIFIVLLLVLTYVIYGISGMMLFLEEKSRKK